MQANQILSSKNTYRVEIKQNDNSFLFAENIPQMEIAVKLSLNIHEAMNTPHIIHVLHDDIIDCTFVRYGTTQQN